MNVYVSLPPRRFFFWQDDMITYEFEDSDHDDFEYYSQKI